MIHQLEVGHVLLHQLILNPSVPFSLDDLFERVDQDLQERTRS